MQFEVVYEGHLTTLDQDGEPFHDDDEGLEEHLDAVMDALLQIHATDPSIGFTGSSGRVEVSVVVEASNLEQALSVGSGVIRSAVHAAGGHTPGWSIDWLSGKASKAEDHLIGA